MWLDAKGTQQELTRALLSCSRQSICKDKTCPVRLLRVNQGGHVIWGGRAGVCWGHEKGEVCNWTINLRSLQAKGGDAT